MYEIVHTDVLEWARDYKGPKFHALLCDPPYELGFMGKGWDKSGIAFHPETWEALAEHLLPGAFGMAFASSRGWHRLAVAIEDAGLRILPSIFGWANGQSFPKATNIHVPLLKRAFQSSVQGGLHVKETIGDFQSDYPERCCFCGEQLQWLEVAFQDGVPSQDDAQAHTHSSGPSVEILVDNERRDMALSRLFFRLSTQDWPHRSLTVSEALSSQASIDSGQQQPSSGETCRHSTVPSCDATSRTSENKMDAQHEHVPQRAQKVVHSLDKQNAGDASLLLEKHSDTRSSKSDSLHEGLRPPDETLSHKHHRQIDEMVGRCIPSLTLSPTLEPPRDLVYTHYTKGCLVCQARAFQEAQQFEGHRYGGQVLKNCLEPIIVFQKPYKGKPVERIVETGAGALNIDGARIGTDDKLQTLHGSFSFAGCGGANEKGKMIEFHDAGKGRWPANFYVSEEAARRLGEQSGAERARHPAATGSGFAPRGMFAMGDQNPIKHNDKGTAARFFLNVDWQLEQSDPVFYCAKASRKERDVGLERMAKQDGLPNLISSKTVKRGHPEKGKPVWSDNKSSKLIHNNHPTIKPLKLTTWLSTLLLPPEEYAPRRILIPFLGSGSEAIGAALAGWEEIAGIEMEKGYVEIAEARLEYWCKQDKQLELV